MNPYFRACVDELEKVSRDYSAAMTSHELGHGRALQGSPEPAVRAIVHGVLPAFGALASIVALVKGGKPHLAAAIAGGSHVPALVEEGLATYHGLKGLRKSKLTARQRRRAAGELGLAGSTYLLSALASVGSIYAHAKGKHALSWGLGIGGLVAPFAAAKGADSLLRGRGSPRLTRGEAETLRRNMGVRARIYHTNAKKGSLDEQVLREIGAFYVPPARSRFGRYVMGKNLDKLKVSKKVRATILRDGGVFLPSPRGTPRPATIKVVPMEKRSYRISKARKKTRPMRVAKLIKGSLRKSVGKKRGGKILHRG